MHGEIAFQNSSKQGEFGHDQAIFKTISCNLEASIAICLVTYFTRLTLDFDVNFDGLKSNK